MNIDPATNLVAFEIQGHAEPIVAGGDTRDERCIERAWRGLPLRHRAAARKVTRIHTEWQPSERDAGFIRRTFARAEVTYSFERPGPDGWEAALAAAAQSLALATVSSVHTVAEGELLPILWSRSSPRIEMLDFLPHRDFIPGRLHLAVARVAAAAQGRIGMSHMTFAALDGRRFDDVLATAASALIEGLRVDGHGDSGKGRLLVIRRDGPFASSAVGLPDFHRQMTAALGDAKVLVGLPDPETVLVTRMDSGWVDELRHAVLASPCPSGELVPSILAFDGPQGAAPRFVAQRRRRGGAR